MTKKPVYADHYPALRLLRSLALGYHLPLLRRLKWMTNIFSTEHIKHEYACRNFCPRVEESSQCRLAVGDTASWQLRYSLFRAVRF